MNQLLVAGAVAGIVEALFWMGVGVYFIRRKMMKRKAKWDWAQRVIDYRHHTFQKSALNEAIDNEYYAVAYDATFPICTQEEE